MYIYIHMYVCMYVCRYIDYELFSCSITYVLHSYIYIYICIHIYISINLYTYLSIYLSLSISLSLYIYIYIYILLFILTNNAHFTLLTLLASFICLFSFASRAPPWAALRPNSRSSYIGHSAEGGAVDGGCSGLG